LIDTAAVAFLVHIEGMGLFLYRRLRATQKMAVVMQVFRNNSVLRDPKNKVFEGKNC
jgi:hypothetical protein